MDHHEFHHEVVIAFDAIIEEAKPYLSTSPSLKSHFLSNPLFFSFH